jgi:2-methylisocitrate lyase-like PEP mutase family enzyme
MRTERRAKTRRFRELIADGRIHYRPSAFDALSAKLLERAGFEVLGISGYAVAATMLGKPDVGLATMTETVRVCRDICNAVRIPVMVDADTGYGGVLNVARTVESIIDAGAAGLFIEDQVEPKRCGHVRGKQLLGLEDAVAKVRMAAQVRDSMDPDFVIMARTDARGAAGGSFDEAVRRSLAYAEAGADIIFPEGLISTEEVVRFIELVRTPINYNRIRPGTGVSPVMSIDELRVLGVRFISNADGALESQARALWTFYHRERARDRDEPLGGAPRARPSIDVQELLRD